MRIVEGCFKTTNADSNLGEAALVLVSGCDVVLNNQVTVRALACEAGATVTQGAILTVLDRVSTSGAMTFQKLAFADGAIFEPNGKLTISQSATFGENLTLDLSKWQAVSGKVLLAASGVTEETFGAVIGLPEQFVLQAQNGQLRLKSSQGLMFVFQ